MGEIAPPAPGLIGQLANLDPDPESVPTTTGAGEGHAAASSTRRAPAPPVPVGSKGVTIAQDGAITMQKPMGAVAAGRGGGGGAVAVLLAGANSVFYGDKLLTTGNPEVHADRALFAKLGLVTGA